VEKTSSNQAHERKTSAGSDKPSVLLIGHAAGAITAPQQAAELGCRQCEDMAEAITLATQERFERIFVVMSSFPGRLESSLGILRQVKRQLGDCSSGPDVRRAKSTGDGSFTREFGGNLRMTILSVRLISSCWAMGRSRLNRLSAPGK